MSGWIGVDLDGTLAKYGGWKGETHIGAPIMPMVKRVQNWIAEGREVRILTARMSDPDEDARRAVACAVGNWTEEHIGHRLVATCVKDYGMVELWDDRAVRVVFNQGIPCCDLPRR
jgi:hypothetical protein